MTFNTSKKYILSMLKEFNNIKIQKIIPLSTNPQDPFGEKDGIEIKESSVPITWGSKERLNMYLDDSFNRGIQMRLPRLALTLDSLEFDTERKTSKLANRKVSISNDSLTDFKQFNSVPYAYEFTLHIITKTLDDYFQIVEQILPYYNPSKNINIIEIPGTESTSIKISLLAVSLDPDIDMDEDGEQRLIRSEIAFRLFGNMYMPLKDISVIEFLYASYGADFINTETELKKYIILDENEDGVIQDIEIDNI